jgi:hypothetical protein
MSDTPINPAEPTENQGGGSGTTTPITPENPVPAEEPEAVVAAEPTENQGGGGD